MSNKRRKMMIENSALLYISLYIRAHHSRGCYSTSFFVRPLGRRQISLLFSSTLNHCQYNTSAGSWNWVWVWWMEMSEFGGTVNSRAYNPTGSPGGLYAAYICQCSCFFFFLSVDRVTVWSTRCLLQVGGRRSFIYIIQLACSIKIIYNCYNI